MELGYSSVAECLPTIHESEVSIPGTAKKSTHNSITNNFKLTKKFYLTVLIWFHVKQKESNFVFMITHKNI
jgi:hypothetical protein